MFSGAKSQFDKTLEKATSQLLLEPDWDAILQICDQIRQNDVQPKYAVGKIRSKIQSDNPHISMFALQTLESVVKNCGNPVHMEIATREFMEFLKDEVKNRSDPVKGKVLELIQVWSHAFRNDPTLKVVQDTYHLMKMEGHNFPTLKESDAMFSAEKAPEWKDGEVCYKCRTTFNMVQRKHHCRACGQVFCGKCSAKQSAIPKFGIEKEVRVCDTCYDQLNKPSGAKSTVSDDGSLPREYLSSSLSQQAQTPASKSDQELQEEEELQLAIALSKSEAENKAKERERMKLSYGSSAYNSSSQSSGQTYQQPTPAVSEPVFDDSEMDPELARYLNRNYWQQKSQENQAANQAPVATTTPSAPMATTEPKTTTSNSNVVKVQEQYQNGETSDQEQFLNALRSSIEIFVNRMRSDSMRGRSIANDSAVQTLFMTINAMHPQLMNYVQEQEDSRAHFEALQDKLTQLKDAREALDALREDHREKKRREAEELERQRQIQMAQKLEIMRQKKQEYLEYQRQLALQRMQEQEREMQMRLEQQKQMAQMRQMQQYGYPAPGYPQAQQGFSPPGSSVEGSPVHRMQQPGVYGPPGSNMGGPPAPHMMGQPGPQQPMQGGQVPMGAPPHGPPQGMPPHGIPEQAAPPMGGQQFSAPGSQPVYSQNPPPQGYQPPPQTVPGGYQPPTTTYQATAGQPMYQPPPGAPAGGMPAGGVPQGQAPGGLQQGYPGQAPYNMQAMSNALPGQGQGQGQFVPPGQYPQGAPPQQRQPGPQEAELISFD